MRSVFRRATDIVAATSLLLLLGPLMLLIAFRLSSSGPIFCYQLRRGTNGKLIRVLKFRVAQVGTYDIHYLTDISPILRNYHLEHLPQLINVIKGDMTLVGRRPVLPGVWGGPPVPSQKERSRVSFGLRFMSIAELLIPQTIAE